MPLDGTDEAPEEVDATETQPAEGQESVEAGDQSSEAVLEGEIVVGNQKFADQAALIKAYQDSMKGHTQATQKHSEEKKQWEPVSKFINGLSKDERKAMLAWIQNRGSVPTLPQAQAAAAQIQQNQAPVANPQADERYDRLESELKQSQAMSELVLFRQSHPELSKDELREIAEYADRLADEGRERTLEEVYRWTFHEKHAAKLLSQGQAKAEEAITKGKKAGQVLNGGASAQPGKPAPKYGEMKTQSEKYNYVRNLMKSRKIKFDSD